ncbi:response regulator [Paenibacillus frigoriresistens]|uniref:response regulator n=1 Tax=Paenibacillus alginolyticus TaxID=59839 RepID=UPI0015649B99|nr:response regulator [Paenibacillus frigoriresistens]NRF94670.1 response regulator [Paenibacillus frigoriresistens]
MSSSLRFKLVSLLVLITCISLTVVGITNYRLSRDKLIHQMKEQSITSVSNSAQNLYDFLSIRLAEVELLSRVDVMKHGTLEERLQFLTQELKTGANRYHSMGIIDLNGYMTLTTGQTLYAAGERRFQEALKGKTFISDPEIGQITGTYIISITAPVFNDRNEVTSIVNISLDAEQIFFEHLHTPLEKGEILIVNQEGLILHHTDTSQILKLNIFTEYPSLGPAFQKALQTNEGFLDESYYGGQKARWFYARVPQLDWYLAYSMPLSAFEAPTSPLLWSTIGLIVMTAVVIFFLIYLTANTLIIKRIKQILHVTESVAAGNFYIKPLIFKSKDELGALAHSVNGMIENLRELFEPFEAFIHHNQYAMIVTDPFFNINHLNTRAVQLLGYSLAEVHKKATPLLWLDEEQLIERAAQYSSELGEYVPADCTALVIRTLRHLKEDSEWTWHHKDGTRFFVQVSVSSITNPNGELKGFVFIARDISDIKESNESRERLLTIVESARDSILSFDENGYIFYMNQACKSIIGLDKRQTIGKHFSEYVDIQNDINFEEGLNTAIREGFWEFEAEVLTKEQRQIFISVIIVPHCPADKGERYFSAITRDITDQVHSKEELIRAKQEADEANLAKGIFLARMSHEIRTPLNGIVGLSYLMERTIMSPLQRDYISKIVRSSVSLSNIINDILDFSKLEVDKLAIEHHAFQLDETIDRVCETLSVLLGHKPVDFICDIHDNVPLGLIGDSLRMYQVLLNLTSNAIKFTEQGTVTLGVYMEQLREEEVRIGFIVSDTGIGMDEEQLSKLFQPFVQADEVTSRKFGGTGLGLVISKNIIENMGGTIEVSSQPELGSEFRISLPFSLSLQPIKTQSILPLRTLIVEDHPGLNQVLVHTLQSMCTEAAGVSSWKEARNAIDVIPVDVILLDMEAVDMYGEEVWLGMLEKCNRMNILTIIYTTLSGRDALEQLPAAWAPHAILVKPISRIVLYQTLQTLTGTHAEKELTSTTDFMQTAETMTKFHRILIVEDNEINQTVARSLLESSMNCDVQLASNGFEALNDLENNDYDLILMDIHMPVLDGIETTKRIRLEPKWMQIPIIALTADSTLEKRLDCIRAGMNEVISKPIIPSRLSAAVDAVLSEKNRTAVPGLDMEEALGRLGGKTEIYHEMLRKFYSQSAPMISQITLAIQKGDYAEAITQLHALRGSSSNLSANRVFAAATILEEMLEHNSGPDETNTSMIQNHLQSVAIALEEVFHSIQKLLLD